MAFFSEPDRYWVLRIYRLVYLSEAVHILLRKMDRYFQNNED